MRTITILLALAGTCSAGTIHLEEHGPVIAVIRAQTPAQVAAQRTNGTQLRWNDLRSPAVYPSMTPQEWIVPVTELPSVIRYGTSLTSYIKDPLVLMPEPLRPDGKPWQYVADFELDRVVVRLEYWYTELWGFGYHASHHIYGTGRIVPEPGLLASLLGLGLGLLRRRVR